MGRFPKKGGVILAEIMLPEYVPKRFFDRSTLWNEVEQVEKNYNAQLAYSFDMALQNEFSLEENIELAREFVQKYFVSDGMICDLAVHQPDREEGGIPNPHFHVLVPIRPLNDDGTWGAKQRREYHLDENGNRIKKENGQWEFDAVPTTNWGKPEALDMWREAWADMVNDKFREKGLDCRIDHRSYVDQGLDLIPTVHEGPQIRKMEKKGIRTEKGELNRWIKATNAKLWFIKLYDDGYSYSTIASIRGVVKPAFQMAYTEDIIRRNPFEFRLDIIPNNTQKRVALSPTQQEQFLEFTRNDKHFCRYLDEIKILLGTGMRISELCGLTIADLDFDRRRIRVDHQLVRTQDGKRYIEKTKTECGCRYIPMSDEVYESFYNILSNRKKQKKEVMIDGYAGFILLDKNGNPKVAMHVQKVVQRLCEKYNEENIIPLPRITPHVFRHTFCTNMANAGMDLKSLQYLMGHSDASVTLNVYTHNSYEKAEESMAQIVAFSGGQTEQENLRRFG